VGRGGADVLSFLLEKTDEDAIAFVRPGGESMTYGSLAVAVRAMADALLGRAGGLQRQPVGIAVEDQAGFLVATLAAWAVEAVPVPLDVRAGVESVRAQAARARVSALVHGNLDEDRLDVEPNEGERRQLDPAAGLVLFTSGSSGEPKGVMLSQAGLEANLDAILAYLPVNAQSRTPLTLPLVYSYSLVGQAMLTLRAGGALVGLGGIPYPAEQLEAMTRLGCDGVSSVATALRLLAEVALDMPENDRPRFRYVASAGGPLDAATIEKLRLGFPRAQLFNQYGLTEASPRVTAISERDPMFLRGSVGKPIGGTCVEERDGELYVRGPSVMIGYLDDPEGTARALGPDGLRTGDRGRVDENGYVFVTGRADGLVKIAGERVSTDEVAETVRGLPGVFDAAVVAIHDERLGAKLVGFVVAATPAAELGKLVRDRLPPVKRPRLIAVEELPRTANGKIDLPALRARAVER
jgi:long-chain acyl-CoA synthetase